MLDPQPRPRLKATSSYLLVGHPSTDQTISRLKPTTLYLKRATYSSSRGAISRLKTIPYLFNFGDYSGRIPYSAAKIVERKNEKTEKNRKSGAVKITKCGGQFKVYYWSPKTPLNTFYYWSNSKSRTIFHAH